MSPFRFVSPTHTHHFVLLVSVFCPDFSYRYLSVRFRVRYLVVLKSDTSLSYRCPEGAVDWWNHTCALIWGINVMNFWWYRKMLAALRIRYLASLCGYNINNLLTRKRKKVLINFVINHFDCTRVLLIFFISALWLESYFFGGALYYFVHAQNKSDSERVIDSQNISNDKLWIYWII